MKADAVTSFLLIAVMGSMVFATRLLPFLIFPEHKKTPKYIQYLSNVLSFSVMGLLVVYCIRTITPLTYPYGLPEFISVAAVVLLHIWKKNNLLSMIGGTILYMFLVQAVFVV